MTYVHAALRAAEADHGFPVLRYAGVPLVDVRAAFPDDNPSDTMRPRDPAQLQLVTQHHDAGWYDGAPPNERDPWPREVQRIGAVYNYHRSLGWGGIGYHTYGFPSGRVYLVGSFETRRACVAGRNHQVIGHVTAGDFTGAPPPTGAQLAAALATIAAWRYAGRLLASQSHHDAALNWSPTECCGATRDQWVPRLAEAIRAIVPQLQRMDNT